MKTRKKTQPSSSQREFVAKKMSFKIPESWGELTQGQLRMIIRLYVIYDGDKDGLLRIQTAALFNLIHVTVDTELPEGFLCYQPSTGKKFVLNQELLPWMMMNVEYLTHPEQMTVRLETMHGCKAVAFDLRDLMFGKYLECENYYQGFIQTMKEDNLKSMAMILYDMPETKRGILTEFDGKAVLLWWNAVKYRFGQMFPHFLKPQGSDGEGDASQMELMNAQIRMLTKGDVTKEDEILNRTSTLRALTELDAQAREAEEIKKMMKK